MHEYGGLHFFLLRLLQLTLLGFATNVGSPPVNFSVITRIIGMWPLEVIFYNVSSPSPWNFVVID